MAFGGQCGECTECGKCERLLNGQINGDSIKKEEKTMEQDKLYFLMN